MSHLPPFLSRLGLDASADERAIRRAYAQQLKAIDPEADPAAFQALHETFEAAKRWARHQSKLAPATPAPPHMPETGPQQEKPTVAAQAPHQTDDDLALLDPSSPVGKPAAPPTENEYSALDAFSKPANQPGRDQADILSGLPPEPPPPIQFSMPKPPVAAPQQGYRLSADQSVVDQEAVSAAVFTVFATRFAEQAAQTGNFDEEAAHKELQHALGDPRLINLQARTGFERRIGQLLANGWQPGHHFLFEVAVQSFHWMDDKRRLDALGEVGPFLNQAMVEYAIFLKSPDAQSKYRKGLIARLRDPSSPDGQEVAANMKTMQALFTRYPNWFRIITNLQNVATWRKSAEHHAKEVEENQHRSKVATKKQTQSMGVVSFFALVFLGFLFRAMNAPSTPNYPYRPQFYPPNTQTQVYPQATQIRPVQTPDLPYTHLPGAAQLARPGIPYAAPKSGIADIQYSDAQLKRALNKIKQNMQYPQPDVRVRNDAANFVIQLTVDGYVTRVDKISSSALPAFDDAVGKAIYRAQPYPKGNNQNAAALFRVSARPFKD